MNYSIDEFLVGDNKWDECLVFNLKIIVVDLVGDGVVKIIIIDISVNVICYNKEGSKFWEFVIFGILSFGSRLYDVDRDGIMDIIIIIDDGLEFFFFFCRLFLKIYICYYILLRRVYKDFLDS